MAVVSFRALQLANEQRNAYGLRYNDFERYRKHCANRTHRLRSTLKMTHGKGKDFKKLPPLVPDNVKEGHLQLLLFEAERAWAYAQELTNQALQPANKERATTLRHSATGRFRRAVNWSTQLLSLTQALYTSSRLSAENLIEITIYTIILNGRFLRYRDNFQDGLVQLSVARGLLDDLSNAASTSRDQALAVLFADEINPEIRYCAHELGRTKSYDVNAIVAELSPKHRNKIVENGDALVEKYQAEEKKTVSSKSKLAPRFWEGQPVPVRYPELVDVLLKVEAAEAILDGQNTGSKKSKQGVTAYDAVLSSLNDAEDVARKLQESQQASSSSSKSTAGGRDIQFVHSYLVYQHLSRRIQRDLLLQSTLLASGGGDKSKPALSKVSSKLHAEPVDSRLYPAIVKLLDTVVQSLTQMRSLGIVDDNPDLATAVDARLSFTNGQRCLYLAHCYSSVKKYAEALALLQRATIYIRETLSTLSLADSDLINDGTPAFFSLTTDDVKALEQTITADGLQYKRDWFAYNGGSVTADPATHKKPLFFNIALNYVELDMDRLQERAGKAPEPTPAATPAVQAKPKAKAEAAVPKAKAEKTEEPTPAPALQQPARGGLGSLLGGWWSKS